MHIDTTFKNITVCKRCGTCCQKGGPTLHKEDKKILLSGLIGYQHLITIRKDELAYSSLSRQPKPVKKELIKLAGKEKGKGWTCCFYDERKSSCTIYRHRPQECRLLKCWDTSSLMPVIGKDTITRADIIKPDNPLSSLIEIHELQCPVNKIESLTESLFKKNNRSKSLEELTELIRKDLAIRSQAIAEYGLPLSIELFIFGRPLFKLLPPSVSVQEIYGNIFLSCSSPYS